ncbi:MAG: SHOCT domain-containing protein [Acidimicrobiales bacterium]|nr:SHOCT domain-containing protein [Acidimicrobiales bacterium]
MSSRRVGQHDRESLPAAPGWCAGRSDDGWFHHMDGWDGGWMWFWGTLMMLSWVVIIAGAMWLLMRSRADSGSSRARDILEERYARGELTTEEYRERLDNLT